MNRDRIVTGAVICTASNTLISKTIRKALGEDYSHTATCYDRRTVVEARGDLPHHSVEINAIADLLDKCDSAILLVHKRAPIMTKHDLKIWLLSQAGKKYDYFNTVFIQALRVLGFGKLFQRTVKRAERKYMCFEFGNDGLQRYLGLCPEWPRKTYTPQMLIDSGNFDVYTLK